ncbi:hypothetical protein PENSPDRAFT_653411 [Peniophora sp. CONT]|nr:hypothetical protein PENSPDRAFT_653411 [Peniophora sp. CONT]
MSARFDALVVLLEKFGSFLERLDIRVNAPLEPVSRSLIVKTLVEMLRTLAYATRMMRQNRAKHFFTVLIGQGGGLTELTNRTEALMIEETRLSLAEVHSRMHDLSEAFMTTLKQIEDDIAELSKRMDALSMDVDGVSEQLRVSGVYDMPQQFHAFMERYEESRVEDGSDRILELSMASLRNDISVQTALITSQFREMRLQRNQRQDLLGRPRASFLPHSNWVSQVSLPCVDMASFARVATQVISCFQGLSPDEQAILKEGIVTLFSAAATSVSMGNSDRTVILAGVLYPGAVLSGFLPMAFLFLAVFAFWRRFVCRTQGQIPWAPRNTFAGSIILIDVFGTNYILQPDMCKHWEDLHDFLLDQYEGKSAVEFIRSHAYRITDPNRAGSFVRRQDWDSVRVGSTLELSFAVRQKSLMCPWCGVHAAVCESERIQCHSCSREFWASNDSVGSTREPARNISLSETVGPNTSRSSRSSHTSDPSGSPHFGLQSYRRIVVVYSDGTESQHRTSAHSTQHSDLDILMDNNSGHFPSVNQEGPISRHRGEHIQQDYPSISAVDDSAGQGYVDSLAPKPVKSQSALSVTSVNAPLTGSIPDHDQYQTLHPMESNPHENPQNQYEYALDVDIEQSNNASDFSRRIDEDGHALIKYCAALGSPLNNTDTLRFLRKRLATTFEARVLGINGHIIRALRFLSTAWSFSGVDSFDGFICMALDSDLPDSTWRNSCLTLQTFHHFDDKHLRLKSGAHYTPHPWMSIWDGELINPYCGVSVSHSWDVYHEFPHLEWHSSVGQRIIAEQIELNFDCFHGVPIAYDDEGDDLNRQSWTLPSSLTLSLTYFQYQNNPPEGRTYQMQLHTSHTVSRVSASRLAKEVCRSIRNHLLHHPLGLWHWTEEIPMEEIVLVGVRFLSPDTVEPILHECRHHDHSHVGPSPEMRKRRRPLSWGGPGRNASTRLASSSEVEMITDEDDNETEQEVDEVDDHEEYGDRPRTHKRGRWG